MRFILLFLLIIPGISFGQSKAYQDLLNKYYDGFPTITVLEAKEKIGTKGTFFLDTRMKKEYNVSHIKNAIHVGYDDFSIKRISYIPKNAVIIVYCSIGVRSQDIGKKLKKAGYTNVRNLYGGLFHWANSGFPMINSSGKKTTSIHGYSKEWGKWVTQGKVVY